LEELSLNKIYNENCLETMARMPDEFVDLTITSPPYDSLRKYNPPLGYSFDFGTIAEELFRVTKQGGVVVWVVADKTKNGNKSLTSFKQAIFFQEIGFNFYDNIIYEKNGSPYSHKGRYLNAYEYMFVLSKGNPKTINLLKDRRNLWAGQKWGKKTTRRKSNDELEEKNYFHSEPFGVRYNIWRYNTGSGYTAPLEENFIYKQPAVFPEKLATDHIYSWSNEGDLIYDPMGGSGTVAKRAIIYKRNWIMSEISAEYCQIAEKRLKPYLQQLHLAI
jgi:site-specific DNA-methyltransferase (adenine-specific)